jgi:agarase
MGEEHFSQSLKMRAEKYEYFVNSCLNNPYIVGAHYFQFLDQPTVGRGDGENFSCGFLNICDRPHEEMVNVSRKIGKEFYQTRYSGK